MNFHIRDYVYDKHGIVKGLINYKSVVRQM